MHKVTHSEFCHNQGLQNDTVYLECENMNTHTQTWLPIQKNICHEWAVTLEICPKGKGVGEGRQMWLCLSHSL